MFKNDLIITSVCSVIHISSANTHKIHDYSGNFAHNELIFKLDGKTTINFGTHVFTDEKGSLRFIKKSENHTKYTAKTLASGNCIHIFFDTLYPVSCDIFSIKAKNYNKLSALFKKAENIWRQKKSGYSYAAVSCLYEILSVLQSETEYIPDSKADKIKPAADYISENFNKNIYIEDLADMCHISHTYFKKIFSTVYGMTPKSYIIFLRMQYACDLLKSRMYKITDVADLTGYQNVYYFSQSFKAAIGMTPSEYMKLNL